MLKVVAQSQLSLQALPRLHDLAYQNFILSPSNHNNKDPNPLAPHLGGDSREEPQTGTDGQQSVEGVRKFVMVGVYHTPKQFLSRAKELNTPLMLQTTLNLSRVRLCRLI